LFYEILDSQVCFSGKFYVNVKYPIIRKEFFLITLKHTRKKFLNYTKFENKIASERISLPNPNRFVNEPRF